MAEVFKKYKLEDNTIDFIGHAVAMNNDDTFMDRPAVETIQKIKLYMDSIGRYGDHPFLYPLYGLGGIPEGFSRFCAIHGGTYMLNCEVDEIVMGEDGKVTGIRSGDQIAKAPIVIADPSYVQGVTGKVKSIGKVIRSICIMDSPIPDTNNGSSTQIILPQKQTGRNSDIYVTMVSYSHAICAQGLYVAIISANVETDSPEDEIKPGLELLGNVLEQFTTISDLYVPDDDGTKDNLYVTKSYDPTSHFESASIDVLDIFERITGEPLDLNTLPEPEEY